MCRLSRLGRSKAFPQTSQGSRARSRLGLDFGEERWWWTSEIGVSINSIDETDNESPDMDLCSSSPLLVGEIGNRTRDISDMERSRGESVGENEWVRKLGKISVKFWPCLLTFENRIHCLSVQTVSHSHEEEFLWLFRQIKRDQLLVGANGTNNLVNRLTLDLCADHIDLRRNNDTHLEVVFG